MIDIGEAYDRIGANARPLPGETVPLADAAGRVLSAEVLGAVDLPGFDRSSMDGWAVRSEDFASPPVSLPVRGDVAAGEGERHLPREDVEGVVLLLVHVFLEHPAGGDVDDAEGEARRVGGAGEELHVADAMALAGGHDDRCGRVGHSADGDGRGVSCTGRRPPGSRTAR